MNRLKFYVNKLSFVFSKKTVQLVHSKTDLNLELVGSWTVLVGDMDQALHLWRYTGGFAKVDLANCTLPKDKVVLPVHD